MMLVLFVSCCVIVLLVLVFRFSVIDFLLCVCIDYYSDVLFCFGWSLCYLCSGLLLFGFLILIIFVLNLVNSCDVNGFVISVLNLSILMFVSGFWLVFMCFFGMRNGVVCWWCLVYIVWWLSIVWVMVFVLMYLSLLFIGMLCVRCVIVSLCVLSVWLR